MMGRESLFSLRLRFLWARYLLWTGLRLERKAVRLFKRGEECRALADRHFEQLVGIPQFAPTKALAADTPGCDVCEQPGETQHSEPDGDTFWLCAGCEAACAEVAREGQFVSLEDASNGV